MKFLKLTINCALQVNILIKADMVRTGTGSDLITLVVLGP
jgi:hypothetical protein